MLARFGYFLLVTAVIVVVDSLPCVEQCSVGAFGYGLLEHRLDQLEQKLQNTSVAERLAFNQQHTLLEKIINSLNATEPQHNAVERQSSQGLDHQKRHQNRMIESCEEAFTSGRYRLQLPKNGSAPITVICDMEVFDGGWLVIQRRFDGSVDFNRNWAEYRDGFGAVGQSSEFWLGLEAIHQLTQGGDHELLVQLKNETGHYGYARYGRFQVAGEEQDYTLSSLDEYSGTIGDQMHDIKDHKFITYDRNDPDSCTETFGGGWWFNYCGFVKLNGPFKNDKNVGRGQGIYWKQWTNASTYSRMLIRQRYP